MSHRGTGAQEPTAMVCRLRSKLRRRRIISSICPITFLAYSTARSPVGLKVILFFADVLMDNKKNVCSKTCCFINKDVIVYCLRIYSILSDQRKEVMIVNIVKSVKYFAVLPCGKKRPR